MFGRHYTNEQIHVQIWRMRKQWIPGPFLSPREKGLGTRLAHRVHVTRFQSRLSLLYLSLCLVFRANQCMCGSDEVCLITQW